MKFLMKRVVFFELLPIDEGGKTKNVHLQGEKKKQETWDESSVFLLFFFGSQSFLK